MPAPRAIAHRLKENLKELFLVVELEWSHCDGVFEGPVVESSAGVGSWDEAIASAFHASTLRRSPALIRRRPKTRVVVMAMEGCCVSQSDALLFASCAAWVVSYMVAYSSPSEMFSSFSKSFFWMRVRAQPA